MEQIGAIAELIDALKKLPGVGPRAAQRIAYQLLNGDRSDANRLGEALLKATKTVHRCARCNNLTDGELCSYCSSHNRDDSLLCIVESVADLMVIEQSLSYHGRYFILMGRLSPLERAGEPEVKEVIIATSFTAEGEATAFAVSELLSKHYPQLKLTRIARGVPAGAEIEYTDVNTVAQAMLNRRVRESD